MEYEMGDEKIEQNIQRLDAFLFHTLGCSKKDIIKMIKGVLLKRGIVLDE